MSNTDGGTRSRLYTRPINQVGNHTTGLKMGEKFMGVWETLDNSIRNALDGTEDTALFEVCPESNISEEYIFGFL